MPDVNTEFKSWLLRHSHYTHRYENGIVKEVAGHYAVAKERILAQISKIELYGTGFTREFRLNRLRGILDEVNVVLDSTTTTATSDLTARLQEFASTHADMVQDELGSHFGKVNLVLNKLPAMQVFAAVEEPLLGQTFGERMLWNNAEAVRAIRDRLTQAVITGEDMATARRELVGLGRQMGGRAGKLIVERAEVIARTEIQRISNSVSKAVYDQNQDVIKGVQYIGVLDRRTCLICGKDDGKIFYYSGAVGGPKKTEQISEAGDRAPSLPRHPRCRCCLAPITRSWKELGIAKEDLPPGTRASWAGQVPEKLTYTDWLKQQELSSPGFAADILGKTRYKLWKDGKLKLNEMAKDNKILSVGQLKRGIKKKIGIELEQKTFELYGLTSDQISKYKAIMSLDSTEAKRLLNVAGLSKEQFYKKLSGVRMAISKSKITKKKYYNEKTGKWVKGREKLHNDIANQLVAKGIAPVGKPKILMTGGYPGSGKSGMLHVLDPKWESKYVPIDSDVIKKMLAKQGDDIAKLGWRAALYHQEADDVIDLVFAKAILQRKNILFDGTMKSKKKMIRMVKQFKRTGYEVEIAFADLSLEKSIERAIGRFLGRTGRFVDPAYIITHGTSNWETFKALRPSVSHWSHYSTDVPFGKRALLVGKR